MNSKDRLPGLACVKVSMKTIKRLILRFFVDLIELQVKLLKTLAHTGSQRPQRAV